MSGASTFSPFRTPMFRWIWIASFASNIGSWMHEVGAAWLMTSLAPTPFMVSLVQVAGTLPIFLLALPSGALADLLDKRLVILFTQLVSAICASLLGALTFFQVTDEVLLLLFTLVLNIGTAVMMPAWQGMMPELVPKEDLAPAIALGGISYNLSRIIGPAIAGGIIASWGPWVVFSLNGASFLGIVLVLSFWRREHEASSFSWRRLSEGVTDGIWFIKGSAPLRAILTRALGFFPFSTVVWALLPLYARRELLVTSEQYGLLLGAMGVGAVLGGMSINRLRTVFSTEVIMRGGMVAICLQLLMLSLLRSLLLVQAVMFIAGVAWSSVMLSFNISTLHAAPHSHRSRASSYFLLVFMGGLTMGSAVWGVIAEIIGIAASFQLAAVLLIVSMIAMRSYRIE